MNVLTRPPPSTESIFAGLGHNATPSAPYRPAIRGRLPEGLAGTLYRNGPGQFSRAGRTKRTVLDGDGFVQRLSVADGVASYAAQFVQTPKYIAECAAGRFLWPTWTSTAPGLRANLGNNVPSQAGVTVYQVGGKLMALDEVAPGFELDPDTLATIGPIQLGLPDEDAAMKAHARRLPETGDWLFASTRLGRAGMQIDIVRHRRDGTRVNTPTVQAPRMTYVHDFGVTERHALFVLHAVAFNPLKFLLGLASFSEALAWKPALGNLLLVVDLATGNTRTFDAPPTWVWHIANCFEQQSALVMDFVGYDDASHFLGPNAELAAIMRGHAGVPATPGYLRRYTADCATGRLTEDVLVRETTEFCAADPRRTGLSHRRIYMAHSGSDPRSPWHTGVAAYDTVTGTLDSFDFGATTHAGEPIFASKPGGVTDDGWLLVQLLETARGATAFAVLDAAALADGPVAVVELEQGQPLSFHGQWVPARG
jgi:all-trans-8'-apo-beta-carotenal 15,15'-oxygenase